MKRFLVPALIVATALGQTPPPTPPAGRGGGRGAPAIQPKPEELAAIRAKSEQIEAAVKDLRARRADSDLLGDVEIYAKTGRILLEYPELMNNQNAIDHSLVVLDQGIERAKQLAAGNSPWTTGKKQIHAYYSAIDGSVQPYAITLPENYDPSKPARLYVWLHGRQNNTTESEFIFSQQTFRPGNVPVADQGQIQVDLFGRINSAGWHWAGEADVFEGIAAVKKRFKIDDQRVLLRGFSMGGEGAWHIALHYPDRFAAAEIGAGTWSRRGQTPGLQPYQYAALKIWENMEEWALNGFNLPVAGHDGDADTQIASLPGPPAGTPTRGQLESSLRTRAQLEKEGFAAEGEPDFLRLKGTPSIFLISQQTGHGTSPLVRQRLDAFLKEWGDKGQTSPARIKFVTYTTRYNRDYWISVDGMDKHYERADVDAQRDSAGERYQITTHNVARLALRETAHAKEIAIDGQILKVKSGPAITLQKTAGAWKVDKETQAGLHKTHALQGPIDDAFLDPFLVVRPTGTPWNEVVNRQALRSMARFDKLWGKFFRGHPFVKDDKDVTAADMAKYHVVLFGDPGSNRVMAKMLAKLPVQWTKDSVTLGGQSYPASENFPAMIYPNPLNAAKYVVLNTGLTIADREYNGDYGMPQWGDYAIVKVKDGADVPDLVTAGLFDEGWKVPAAAKQREPRP
ncbi:MAG: alpha/beta hydrolase-fold protein [Candidatus Solibacter sp.]